jgi:hypothetical protein
MKQHTRIMAIIAALAAVQPAQHPLQAAPDPLPVQSKDSEVEHKAKLEAQWKIQISALVYNNKPQFESVITAASKQQPGKVNFALAFVNGIAKKFKLTDKDLRVDNIKFNATFTSAAVTASYKDASAPGGWTKFTAPENWVLEGGEWLRVL